MRICRSTNGPFSRIFQVMQMEVTLYLICLKQQGRNRHSRKFPIVEIKINRIGQNLPVELDRFWDSSNNKMQLQKVFITCLCDTYSGAKAVYLGGVIPDNITLEHHPKSLRKTHFPLRPSQVFSQRS